MRYFPRFVRTGMLLGSVGLLTACEDFKGIKSLSDLGRRIDPVPGDVNRPKETSNRPAADSRGIIAYPTYKVIVARRGDSLADIAARCGAISAAELAKHNGLSVDYRPRDGELLALPKGACEAQPASIEDIASSAIDEAPNTPAVVPGTTNDGPEPVRHIVEDGETAYSIARLYGVSVTALASWNGLDNNLSVREGQQLLIPVATESTASNTRQAEPEAAAPAPVIATAAPGSEAPAPLPPSASEPLPEPVPAVAETRAETDPKPQQTASASRKLLKPVNGTVLRPFSNKPGGNEGIDFKADAGAAVKAAEDGTVALISKSVSDTTIVLIRHADNLYTVYSNVDAASVGKGDKVKRGQTIGKVGPGSPAYVHFEVRRGTEAVDPMPYL